MLNVDVIKRRKPKLLRFHCGQPQGRARTFFQTEFDAIQPSHYIFGTQVYDAIMSELRMHYFRDLSAIRLLKHVMRQSRG